VGGSAPGIRRLRSAPTGLPDAPVAEIISAAAITRHRWRHRLVSAWYAMTSSQVMSWSTSP